MNSEVVESTRIIKVINEHLAESDCHHNIKSIMQEALEYKSGLGNQPNPTVDDDTTTQVTNRNDQR
jgi:hypothetical protein